MDDFHVATHLISFMVPGHQDHHAVLNEQVLNPTDVAVLMSNAQQFQRTSGLTPCELDTHQQFLQKCGDPSVECLPLDGLNTTAISLDQSTV